MVRRGTAAGRDSVRALEALISAREANGQMLPMNGAALHLGEICALLGVGRSTVTQNAAFQQRLRAYAAEKGIAFSSRDGAPKGKASSQLPLHEASGDLVPASELRAAERRIATLEKRLSEMMARNAALVAQLAQAQATEDHLMVRGRRLRPGGPMTPPRSDDG